MFMINFFPLKSNFVLIGFFLFSVLVYTEGFLKDGGEEGEICNLHQIVN